MTETGEQKQKITLGLITSWSLGALCLLSGVASLLDPEKAGSGAILILTALLLLPPVRAFAYRKTGRGLSGGVRIVAVLILLGMATAALPSSYTSSFDAVEPVSASTGTTAATIKASPASAKNGLEVTGFDMQMDSYGFGKIVGTVTNGGRKQFSYVQLEFNLYDESGAQVGSTLANVNNLEPGGTWRFEAPVLESRATQARLKGITSF